MRHFIWNTVLEGLLADVLMLACPMQVDQFDNANLLADEMGAAIRVCEGRDTVPDTKKLAQILRGSMSSDRPERIKAMDLSKKALDAIKEGGCSYTALDELIREISNFKISEQKRLQVQD